MGDARTRRTRRFFTRVCIYRYTAMIIICILGLGCFACYDSVGSLQEAVMEFLNLSASEFSLFYSICAWPNAVLCMFGGFIIDRYFGIELGTLIFAGIFAVGHFVFALGVFLGTFWLAIVGRFIFGIGMETMFVCILCYIVLWFREKELSMVTCIMVSVTRLGTSMMYEIAPPLYSVIKDRISGYKAIGAVYFIVGILAIAAVGCSIILKYMDPSKYQTVSQTPVKDEVSQSNKIKLKDILQFPLTYWSLVVSYSVFVSAIFVLIPFSQVFFMEHFDLTVEAANSVTSFFSILSAVLAPLMGILVDKIGRTVYFLHIGIYSLLAGHLILTFSNISPYVAMLFMSIAMAMFICSLPPMISFVIPLSQLGSALGINIAFTNGSFAVNLVVMGILVDQYGTYVSELYLIGWSILGAVSVSLVWWADRRSTGVLNMSTAQRQEFELKEKAKNNQLMVPLRE